MVADVLLAALREEVRVERVRFDSAVSSGALSSKALSSKQKKWSVTSDPTVSEALHAAWRRMLKRGTDCSVAALALEFFLQREILDLRTDDFHEGVSIQASNDAERKSEYVIDQELIAPENLVEAFRKCIPSMHVRKCITSWLSQGGFALLDRAFLLSGKPVVVPGPSTQTISYSLKRIDESTWAFQMWCTKENFGFIMEGNSGQPTIVQKDNSRLIKGCVVTVKEVPIDARMLDVDVEHNLSKERVAPRDPNAFRNSNLPTFCIAAGERAGGRTINNTGLFSSVGSSSSSAKKPSGFELPGLAVQTIQTELIVEVNDVKDVRQYTRLDEYGNLVSVQVEQISNANIINQGSASFNNSRMQPQAQPVLLNSQGLNQAVGSVNTILEAQCQNISQACSSVQWPNMRVLNPTGAGHAQATGPARTANASIRNSLDAIPSNGPVSAPVQATITSHASKSPTLAAIPNNISANRPAAPISPAGRPGKPKDGPPRFNNNFDFLG